MEFAIFIVVLSLSICSCSLAAVHDELPQCGLHGVYRQRQSVIESPNYPDNYPINTCWDYVIRSPYHCPTKFHIQFLDFQLELSENCSRDYLAIGLQNDGDDMDVLCGQVLGIKKYHTPDGILRLRFLSDDSPWTTNGGFKLLITRLACERDDLSARGLEIGDDVEEGDEDTVIVNSKVPPKKLLKPLNHHHHHQEQQQQHNPLEQHYPWNITQQGVFPGLPFYHPPGISPAVPSYPSYPNLPFPSNGFFYPPSPPSVPPLPQTPPCSNPSSPAVPLPVQQQQQQQQLPLISDQYQTTAFHPQPVTLRDYDPQSLQQFGGQVDLCCSSSFNQNHFYLSSPGFPRTILNALVQGQQRDCVFYLEKSTSSVCGLRIQFKFFDFGQGDGNALGGLGGGGFNQRCTGDFLEIDGQRYCGCRSGHVHKSHWAQGRKAIRMRQSGVSNGFLLEIFQDQDQDGCRQAALGSTGFGQQQQLLPSGGVGVPPLPPWYQSQLGIGLPSPTIWPSAAPQLQPGYPNTGYYPLISPYRQARDSSTSWARGFEAQQPSRVIETNSTRKEFYYFDGDEAFARSGLADDEEIENENGVRKNPPIQPVTTKAFEQSRCTFDYMEVLKLSVDTLWLTKPLCFSPLRSWFGNVFG
ncbi:uncharacterized protein Dwil_GK24641 [Drosophila willistoni]|uniref:CUB domain-containing protein n=1 Tax=Drosophila willistoni TaxID=7260 RepID=B4N0V1_DROWI|nr:uncharacterized protein LOC6644054 [Drosophila willistoni]EDW77714.1 uncharacterized protein Dwil_GK24641 [Drosophila willistoni]